MTREIKRILITAVQVPFTRGGAEILVDGLKQELVRRGFSVDVVQLPFSAHKEDLIKNCALWKGLDLTKFGGEPVDLVIGTKFPSYFVQHPRKVVWLVHQHRQMYELYGTQFSDFSPDAETEALRRVLQREDKKALDDCKAIYTISPNVTGRLDRYLGLKSEPLLPPLPLGVKYTPGPKGDYILSVGRICRIKRLDLIVKALPQIHKTLRLKVVGVPDEPDVDDWIRSEIDKHHLWHRVEFLGRVGDDELISLYREAFAVYYAPFDEDYGFVTLEGLASGKPIITARDSGGVLSFVRHEVNGMIAEPTEPAVAAVCNRLYEDTELYDRLVANARAENLTNTWDEVIASLTAPIEWRQAASA